MSHFSWKAHQLRGFFVVYTLARLAVEIILGWGITRDMLGEWHFHGINRLLISPGVLLTLIIFITGIIFALGLWLFYNLLQKKNWARIVLLVVGWLAVIDAIFSLLLATRISGFPSWLTHLEPGLDWQRVMLVDRIKDILGLLFWGYLIVVLQFDHRVKRDFFPPTDTTSSSQ